MISVVIYGRNDNYGYNLHKRAALSFNCIAEVLTDPSDEILFVDYNTPDDFPTFPEAIQDTLTERARNLLRIFRVRPQVHARYKDKTPLVALEPIARNVAIRRSNPSNRWILSTNTDMIFVPQRDRSLTEAARKLPAGIYHAPRIEIPEALWESFDRKASGDIIDTVRQWGHNLHLNEIVLGAKTIRYDGPGDFQLLLRDDLFENHGFDEEMLLGWHVDSNIAKRMCLKYGEVGDLGTEIHGYHCDHTRQATPTHSHARAQNDWQRFVDRVDRADVPKQASSWGCADELIEEVRLVSNPARNYVQALREAIGTPLAAPNIVEYTGRTYNKGDYDPRHLMPFLADMFVSMPRGMNVAWYGSRLDTLRRFATVWEKLRFTGQILTDRPVDDECGLASTAVRVVPTSTALAAADAFVFDFGGLPGDSNEAGRSKELNTYLKESLYRVVREERSRLASGTPRRVIALNAINNAYERFVCAVVAAPITPYATHMRHGFVLPPECGKQDWLPLVGVGEAGVRIGQQIKNDRQKIGFLTCGPYKYLDAGLYQISIKTELLADAPNRPKNAPCLVVEILSDSQFLTGYCIRRCDLEHSDHNFLFYVSSALSDRLEGIEVRLRLVWPIEIIISALTVEPAQDSAKADGSAIMMPPLLGIADCLPHLHLGPLGRRAESGVDAQSGQPEFVVYGPYWPLPPGKYEMLVSIRGVDKEASAKFVIAADVTVGGRRTTSADLHLEALSDNENSDSRPIRLPFDVPDSTVDGRRIETRIRSSGQVSFSIRSLTIRARERPQLDDLFQYILPGKSGRRADGRDGEIKSIGTNFGCIAYTPAIELKPGCYRLAFRVAVQQENRHPESKIIAHALVKRGPEILDLASIKSGQGASEHELSFEVPLSQESATGIDFFLWLAGDGQISLYTLVLAPIERLTKSNEPAACRLDNWIPHLQIGPVAHADASGIEVAEGAAGYALFGPRWTLPAGHYEFVASLAANRDRRRVVRADVVAEGARRLHAACRWRVGAPELDDNRTTGDFRLPFRLGGRLPAESRTIETRLWTAGDAGFRIRSVTVKFKGNEPEPNWSPRNWFQFHNFTQIRYTAINTVTRLTFKARGFLKLRTRLRRVLGARKRRLFPNPIGDR